MNLHWPDPRRLIARSRAQQALRCPLCFEGIEVLQNAACVDCGIRTHRACVTEFGGCPSGCGAGSGPNAQAEASERLSAWQEQARQRLARLQETRWAENRRQGRRRPHAAKGSAEVFEDMGPAGDPLSDAGALGFLGLVLLAVLSCVAILFAG